MEASVMSDPQPPSQNVPPAPDEDGPETAFSVPALLLGAWQSYLQTLPELVRHTGPLALLIAALMALLGDAGAGGSKLFWAWLLYIPLMLVSLRVLLGERGAEVYRLPSAVLWRFVLTSLAMGVLVSIGFALLVVPGVLLLALTLVYPVLLLEERQSPLDAVVNSMDYSKDALIPLTLGIGVLYVAAQVLQLLANSLFEVHQLPAGFWLMVWQLLYWFASFYFLSVMVAVYHNLPSLHRPVEEVDDLPGE
jgi:uncharacterized membrane protein YoaK (UPF0700 family)